MKKKLIIAAVLVVVAALAVFAGTTAAKIHHERTYITIGQQEYLRNIQELEITVTSDGELEQISQLQELQALDLQESRLTTGQYDALRAALPQCDIRWQVPFQGGYLPCDTREIQVTTLSHEDLQALAYLPELTKVDASDCQAYESLDLLIVQYPQIEVTYNVTVEGKTFPHTTTAMELENPDVTEMAAYLRYLPQLETVTLAQMPEDLDGMMALESQYPNVTFHWQLQVCGVTVDHHAEEIDLSGIRMKDTQELESKLTYLPKLKKVDMVKCRISDKEMEALNNRHEDVLFVWEVMIGYHYYRTDIETFIPVKDHVTVTKDDVETLRYLTELMALDLGHMKIYSCEFIRCMPHLKYLILADTGIKDISPLEGLKELIFLELFVNKITDFTPLLSLTALEDLNVSYVFGQYEVISQMTWLDRLWWSNYRLTKEECQYVRDHLPDTEINLTAESSTGEGWRLGKNYFDMRDVFGMGYMTH